MTDEIKEQLTRKPKHIPTSDDFLSTGSTLLNLSLTGNPYHGFQKGKYYRFVGDSSSGKTFVSLTCLAEASINDSFKDYDFYFNAPEHGALMDMRAFFGANMAARLMPPGEDEEGNPIYSHTVEHLYQHLHEIADEGDPFIEIVDSMDVISTEADDQKDKKKKKATEKGEKTTGSFGTSKAKANKAQLGKLLSKLEKSGSILIVISQTIYNVGITFGDPKTSAGGRSLEFNATAEIWSQVKKPLYKELKDRKKKVQIGNLCELKVKKNRHSGRVFPVEVPFYWQKGVGMDDIGSMVHFLDTWEFGYGPVTRLKQQEAVIRHIIKEKKKDELIRWTAECWKTLEDEVYIERECAYE